MKSISVLLNYKLTDALVLSLVPFALAFHSDDFSPGLFAGRVVSVSSLSDPSENTCGNSA